MILVKTMSKEQKGIVINLVAIIGKTIEFKDGKRIVKDDKRKDGELMYRRNDCIALQQLLHKFDSREHPVKDWGFSASIKEKLYDCIIYDRQILEVSNEEASFLKRFLEQFPTKEGKNALLQSAEIQVRESILEQLK